MVSASSYLVALVLAGCLVAYSPLLGGVALAVGFAMVFLVRGERHA